MSDVGGVSGGQPERELSPEEIERYRDDYNKGFKLFQEAFNDYNKPDVEIHKKAKFQDVMNKALAIMNETACVAISEGKRAKEAQLSEDYTAFINQPTPESQMKVSEDISSLQ